MPTPVLSAVGCRLSAVGCRLSAVGGLLSSLARPVDCFLPVLARVLAYMQRQRSSALSIVHID